MSRPKIALHKSRKKICYHLVCEFFEDFVVLVCICFSKIAARYYRLAESETVRLWCMYGHYTNKLSKTFAAGQLPVHHDKKLIPATERLDIFISFVFHNDSLKCFLREKFDELCKNIFPSEHNPKFTFVFKNMNSNRGHAFLNIDCTTSSCYVDNI